MDKLGRQSVYITDRALAVELKKLAAELDETLIELVAVGLRHMLAVAHVGDQQEGYTTLEAPKERLTLAERMAYSHRAAEGKGKKKPVELLPV